MANAIIKLLGTIALVALSIFYTLFVLSKIYALTIIPLGAPALDNWQMYGVLLFVSATTLSHQVVTYSQDKEKNALVSRVITHAIGLALLWGLTYLIYG